MTDDLKRAAYHEGGHAAACIALGLPVSSVTVMRSVGLVASTHVDLGGDPLSTAIVCLAGPVASKRLDSGDSQTGMEDDFARADVAINTVTDECRPFANISDHAHRRASIALRVREAAQNLVVHHWPEIISIAEALLKHDTLAGDTAARIFERSLKTRGGSHWVARSSQ